MAVIVVVLAAMLHYSAAQTVHVVGDNTGWTVPQGGAATYTSWASGRQFVVGDTLGNKLYALSFLLFHFHVLFLRTSNTRTLI